MDSGAEDTKSQMTPSSTPSHTHKHKKNTKKNKNKNRAEAATPNNPEQLQTTIKVVPSNPDTIAPLVGYFPSGFDPTKHPDPQVRVFRHKQRGGRLELVVTPNVESSGPKVDYVGTSYSGEAQVGELCSYGLGVLDKATQILRIAPIAGNKIFRLEAKVQRPEFDKESANPDKGDAKENILKFQTRKAQRQNKKMKNLRLADDHDSQTDLDALKPVETNTEGPEATADHNSRNTPPFDATATHPEKAYPLDKIISSAEWESLQDISKLLQAGSVLSRDAFPTFVCNRVHKLQRIKDEDQKNKLSCILTYITHLIKFKDLHSMDGFSSAKNHKMPPMIKHKFLSMFEPAAKKMSPEKSNLLISYVLVLTLFADEFQTSLPDIATDLRMSRPTLRTQYERLGCKITGQSDSAVVKLPVPLQFPTMKRKRSKR